MQKFFHSFLYVISFLLALALSIKNFREPDLWWQIRTGEWIMQHHQVPTTDVFSFTHAHQPWINIKWGFEVIAAFICAHAGPECVFILQMLASLLLILFFYRLLILFNIRSAGIFFLAVLLLLLSIEYRMIGRPEMISHLMVMIYLYLLMLHEKSRSKLIWLIIPLQIIWTNMHEAYAIGIVMTALYTLTRFVQAKRNNTPLPVQAMGLTLAAITSIVINPRGILLLTRPFNIFGQVQQNKYTTELDNIFIAEYWHKESWIFVVLALIFLFVVIQFFRKKAIPYIPANGSLPYLTICAAFLLLGFTAYRNIVFFVLSVMPLIACLLHQTFKKIDTYQPVLALIGVIAYGLVVSNKYYAITNSRDRFGLEVLSTNNPSGAASFIAQRQLQSKKGFSDYLTSSYLLWKLQPDFKTYIDLRDLDIFSTAFFEKYLGLINQPEQYFVEDKEQQFAYAVVYTRSNDALHYALYNDSIYACTYADPVAAVYEKTDSLPQGDFFQPCKSIPHTEFADLINKLFNPAYSYFDYEAQSYDYEAAMFYTRVGKISFAEKRINAYLQGDPENEEAQALRSQILSLKSKMTK